MMLLVRAVSTALVVGIVAGAVLAATNLPSPTPPTVAALVSGSAVFAGMYVGHLAVTLYG